MEKLTLRLKKKERKENNQGKERHETSHSAYHNTEIRWFLLTVVFVPTDSKVIVGGSF